jgi:hypothetical protein
MALSITFDSNADFDILDFQGIHSIFLLGFDDLKECSPPVGMAFPNDTLMYLCLTGIHPAPQFITAGPETGVKFGFFDNP